MEARVVKLKEQKSKLKKAHAELKKVGGWLGSAEKRVSCSETFVRKTQV